MLHMEAKKQTRKKIEQEVLNKKLPEKESDSNMMCDFIADDEDDNNETIYELCKLRKLKRIKCDREEREK